MDRMHTKFLSDMFVLGLPIAEKILRPIVVYVFLIVGLRLAGKRELAQLNPFDLVVLLTLVEHGAERDHRRRQQRHGRPHRRRDVADRQLRRREVSLHATKSSTGSSKAIHACSSRTAHSRWTG